MVFYPTFSEHPTRVAATEVVETVAVAAAVAAELAQ